MFAKQRFLALFLLVGFVTGVVVPPASAYAETVANQAPPIDLANTAQTDTTTPAPASPAGQSPTYPSMVNSRKGAAPDTKTPMKEDYPGGLKPAIANAKAAADAKPVNGSLLATLSTNSTKGRPAGEVLQGIAAKPQITPRELTGKRTADSTTSLNTDGSLTKKQYFTPQFFQKNGAWTDIDTSLIEDKNAADSGNIFGRVLGGVEAWFAAPAYFQVKDNDWQARFAPSDFDRGMVRIKKGDGQNSQIGFVPVGAKKVNPVITADKDGRQTVHYYDLWPGIDVTYVVESAALKENVIIKNKDAANKVSFRVVGAELEKQAGTIPDSATGSAQTHSTIPPVYAIKGALNDEFAIAPANLILNNFGFVSDQGVFSQIYQGGQEEAGADAGQGGIDAGAADMGAANTTGGTLTLAVDKTYLQNLPDKAFPAVIDPGVFNSSFGTRGGGNYVSFKSDGYICPSHVCNLYGGSLYDSAGWLRYWRGAYFAPYDQFRNSNTLLMNATLHLAQRTNESFWTGDWGTHNFQIGHATCLNNFNCVDGVWASGNVGATGDINVTNLYQAMIAGGDFGGWMMVMGEDGTDHSFKNFDPGTGPNTGSYVSFTYGGPPPAPSIATPTNSQVYVDPQPSFKLNAVSNPNGNTPLKYEILVSTDPGAGGLGGAGQGGSGQGPSGGLITSNLMDAAQWTIPDGILQDGSTYYVQARSFDPITSTYSGWGTSVPFRIDMRTGKDKTQTYDTLGPVDVDLATGNLATSAASHTSTALGGSLGISLDYNSPLKSRNGLVGEYWNVPAGYGGGAPATTPNVTRVDQNIDFAWDTGSPSAGTVTNDWFYTRWTGYFTAPVAGNYYFGGNNDDLLVVNVNNQQVYSNGGCYTGVCYGSSINLAAGQVVPIRVEHQEATGPAYARLYVKGPVDEQIVPQAWLQTGVRPISNQRGLTGSYYGKFDGSNTFSAGNSLIMKRTDQYLSFDWGTGAPMPNGPEGFLVRWSGYITAPATGTYNFGVRSDDGAKIMLGTNNTVVYNEWIDRAATESYGSGYVLTANTSTPITIEYYDAGGPASFQLKVQGAVPQQIVPSDWLSPKAQVLPDGWNLGIDPDGDLNYDHIKINQNSVVLTDSTGATHEYTWTGSGYKPPVNEDGQLVRNTDGTFTMQDTDGRTYIFSTDGTLKSVTNPVDDRKPAALQYTYASINGGPAALTQITDAVDNGRWAKVYYSGDTNCGTAGGAPAVPSGFDANAPAGMLCAVKTNDGRATYFYYVNGQLARIAEPGNELTDYQYETVMNNGVGVGYRLVGIRDNIAIDAIAAGVRANDSTVNTQMTYDVLGRVVSVTQPAPTTGAARMQHTVEYLPGALDKSYYGLTKQHIVNGSEPNGFTRRIKYDGLFRTIEDTDIANLSDTTEWDAVKDLVYSTTDEAGLKSTTIYDDEDRPTDSYGPAPAAWFGGDHKPLTSPTNYLTQVPHTSTAYDQGITGLAVAYQAATRPNGSSSLANGQSLVSGQSLWSSDNRFQLIFQADGNIVLRGPSGVLWSTGTSGQGTTSLLMQSDGNLVAYSNATPRWSSNTTGGGSTSTLKLQNDGNLVIYNTNGPIWSSGTMGSWPASNVSLTGAPLLHSTNIANDGTITKDFGAVSPIPDLNDYWGMSLTGKLRLPTAGNWTIRVASDNGVRVLIDDKIVINDWADGGYRSHPAAVFDNPAANAPRRVTVQYYHTTGNASFGLYLTPPGGSETAAVAQYFSPDYSLVTGTTTYDSTLGNSTASTNYGSNPELGLAQSSSVDPAGLNLTTANTYETQGAAGSFLRQTSKNLPGNPGTNPSFAYSYYGATETRDNPCTTGVTEAYKQAGFLKLKTEADPDGPAGGGAGGGPQTGRTTETIYDDAGRIVATRYNADAWTCTTYDIRGRVTQTTVPAYNGQAARTIQNNYAVGGDPLQVTTGDESGWITTWSDLLGRTTKYRDIHSNETTSTYDTQGRLSQRVSPLGTEVFEYDAYNRLLNQKLDGTIYATVYYDQYGRMDHVDYPDTMANGGQSVGGGQSGQPAGQRLTLGRDSVGRTNSMSYNVSTSAPGPNLAPNPSLEQSAGTPAAPTQWYSSKWGTNTTNFTYATDGHPGTGSRSAKTEVTSYTNGDAKWYFEPVTISGNTTYTFRDYYRSSVSTSVVLQYTNSDNSNSYVWLGDLAASSTWTQASFSFTAPANAVKVTTFHLIAAVGWLQIDDAELFVPTASVTIADSVTRSQSNQITGGQIQQTQSSGSSSIAYNYGYDNADRLTTATIGSHTYTYGYGLQNSTTCGTGAGTNPNSGKNSNRTSQTIDGVTSYFCYDYADKLTASSDPVHNAAVYDSHGNLTTLGSNDSPLRLCYDSSDRNWCFARYSSSNGNGLGLYYGLDPQGRIQYREKDTITGWNWAFANATFFGYTGSGDTPDFIRDANWNITEKTIQLPGGVLLTIKPQEPQAANQKQYSLPNIHGDTLLTTNTNGVNTSTGSGPLNSYMYDPFGNAVAGSAGAVLPANTLNGAGSYGYVGQHEKLTESTMGLTPIRMGARIYLPTLGRFAIVDPVEGGTENNYVYPTDPVNEFDLTGEMSLRAVAKNTAGIASWGSIIPGPVGMASASLSAVAYAAAGDKKQALIMAGAVAAAAVGAGMAVKAYQGIKKAETAGKVARAAKGGVYVARTTTRQLYVGQTNNFAIRAAQHARSGKIAQGTYRLQIPIASKPTKNLVERTIYNTLGGKRAPWLANKIKPPRWR